MFSQIVSLAEKKWRYHQQAGHPDWTTHEHYLVGINEEIEEMSNEVRPDNTVYLEDELADVLRDYTNLLVTLAKQGYISSVNNVVERCYHKYDERLTDKIDGKQRAETKARQKQGLKEEHDSRYSTN